MKDTLKRQRLFFISLVGIVVVSLMMSVTYAYQTINVRKTEGSSDTLAVKGGLLDVSIENQSDAINITNMPLLNSYESADYYEFTINNKNSTGNVMYQINLKELEYSPALVTKDFKYTITEVNYNEDDTFNETLIKTGDFSTLTGTEYQLELYDQTYNYIKSGDSQTIRLYLWLKETDENQNALKKATFKGKIEMVSIFESDMLTFAETIISNAETITKEQLDLGYAKYSARPITQVLDGKSVENESLLVPTEDDYGTTYYFRGNVKNNYVNFSGMCWRIVRIQGDGSIKLLLASENGECQEDGALTEKSSYIGNSVSYSYGYKKNSSGYYEPDYINNEGGKAAGRTNIKEYLNTWLNSDKFTEMAKSQLKEENWCIGDLKNAYSLETNQIIPNNTINQLLQTSTKFMYSAGYKVFRGGKASLICDKSGGIDGEIDKSKIGMLTMDEVAYAGAMRYSATDAHPSYYINHNATEYSWWLLSLSSRNADNLHPHVSSVSLDGSFSGGAVDAEGPRIRAAVVLNTGILTTKGTGTQEDPYYVGLAH